MATPAATLPRSFPTTNRSADRIFFPVFVLAMLAVIIRGFANTYYLAGMVHAPLPNALIHVHGAVFSLWLVMLAAQTGLVAAGRTDIHRKLGYAGFALVCLMMVMGILAGTDSMRRGFAPPGSGLDAKVFYIVPITDIVMFAVFMYFAFQAKSRPAVHKRLIVLGTLGIMDAAIARFPYAFVQQYPRLGASLFLYSFFLVLMIYDWATTKRVQKVTIWGTVAVVFVEQLRIPIAFSPAWHGFANFMANHLRV